MSAILFDLDGVLYEGDRPIEGAAAAVNWFDQNNIPHLFLTNTTSKSRAELVNKLAHLGIDSAPENFLTPPVAAKQWLQTSGLKNIALFVPKTTRQEFSGFHFVSNENDDVDAVVIGDLGQQWTFEIMNHIFRMLINNSRTKLVALGMTRYWRTANGLQMDVGPMIKAIEYATDRQAVVTGKPSIDFYKAAMDLLAINKNASEQNVVMIGDDIRGDVEASQRAGLKALLVRTGKFTGKDLELGVTPDAILDSVAQLPEWWQVNM